METISPHAFSNAPKSYGKHRHPKDHKIKWFHSSSNQLKVTTACTLFHGYNVELGVLESKKKKGRLDKVATVRKKSGKNNNFARSGKSQGIF